MGGPGSRRRKKKNRMTLLGAVSPDNATVLAGSEARFNCTVSAGWKVLIWLSKGSPVLTVINSQGSVETTDRFTSHNYTTGNEFTSELIIHNTQLSDSGRIECSIQQPSENNFAFLSVQGVNPLRNCSNYPWEGIHALFYHALPPALLILIFLSKQILVTLRVPITRVITAPVFSCFISYSLSDSSQVSRISPPGTTHLSRRCLVQW
uniref:Uncharacterized protein n=1 Tax=Corvus moneduloides TaxID=1196302 RepID=A0A8U7MV17_CORMO